MKPGFLIFLFILFLATSYSQKELNIQILTTGTNTSLRGMSVPTETVVWVSGSNGTVGKSTDGGKTWRWLIVTGYEKRDFRDIEAFDSSTAIIMAVDNPAYLLKTVDGGTTWKKVFEKNTNGMFLDAMDFKNDKEGICIGDPLPIGRDGPRFFYVIRTYDGGNSWLEIPTEQLAPAANGEAIFAASGTNISFLKHPDFDYAFVTGGMVSNLIMIGRNNKPNKVVYIPVVQKKESAGTFSMAVIGQKKIYCIGGDYKIPANDLDNFSFTLTNGNKWKAPLRSGPTGYRSCISI
ncbi:MAG: oxidoreductase, partial [Segetibacter sp.]